MAPSSRAGARRGLAAIALFACCAWPAVVTAQRPAPAVSILGRVVDSLSQPVPDAEISVQSLPVTARTDPFGRFRLNDVPEGLHLVRVRKIGFGPVDIIVRTPRDTSLAAVVLTPGAVQLQTVVTTAVDRFGKPGRLAYTSRYDQFYQRRALNSASGRFYTHEDIDRMGVTNLLDILRRIPPLRVSETADGITLNYPRCHMDGIYIALNGVQIWPRTQAGRASPLDELKQAQRADTTNIDAGPDVLGPLMGFNANTIEAIASYPGGASLPVEAMGNACAAIYFWTR